MPKISLLDYAFLAFESDKSPKHVAGLQIFELPDGAKSDFISHLVGKIKKIEATAPFDQRVETRLTGLPRWVQAVDFDLDDHVFVEAVPAPHDEAALLERIEDLHACKLDRSGPLWELYFFEHLDPGRFAVYFKVHHAYMDGISLSHRATNALSDDHRRRSVATFWGVESDEISAKPLKLIKNSMIL